jgi:hypothetical protein
MANIYIERAPSYKYHLAPPSYRSFSTGVIPDGRQALFATLASDIVLVTFQLDGHYLDFTTRRVQDTMLDEQGARSLLMPVPDHREWMAWKQEIRFTPQTISVCRFFIDELEVGIEDIPRYYRDVLLHPGEFEAQEVDDVKVAVERWLTEGSFVFLCGTEYWIDKAGEVEAT